MGTFIILLLSFLPFPLPHSYESYTKGDHAPVKQEKIKGAVLETIHMRVPL